MNVYFMGNIYLSTGTSEEKTVNAPGLALRSVSCCHTVVIVQFLKWWKNAGEYKMRSMLNPYYEICQFGRGGGTDYEIWTRGIENW